VRTRDELGEVIRTVRLGSPDERSRWSVVSECQRSAAAGRNEQMLKCLLRTDAWPEDASVRKWAGALLYRAGERSAARRHFDAALALDPSPELRVHLAVQDPEARRTLGAPVTAWESSLVEGLSAFNGGQFEKAQRELEAALLHGAPPVLVLPALSRAAAALGDRTAAESARRAFVGLPHFDPATADRLRPSPSS
jgi:tetratricopeptide (TPR) repeat protein